MTDQEKTEDGSCPKHLAYVERRRAWAEEINRPYPEESPKMKVVEEERE